MNLTADALPLSLLEKPMFFLEKLVLWYLPEPGKPAVKMRPFLGLPPLAARSGLYGWRGSGCFCFCSQDDITPSPSSGAAVGGRRLFGGLPRNGVKGGKRLLVFQALHGSGRRTRCSCRGNVGDASPTGVFQAQRHFHGRGVAGCPRSGGGGRQRLYRWLETGGYFPLRIPLLLFCSLRFHHFQLVPHRLHLIWPLDLGRLFRLIMIGEALRILGQQLR